MEKIDYHPYEAPGQRWYRRIDWVGILVVIGLLLLVTSIVWMHTLVPMIPRR